MSNVNIDNKYLTDDRYSRGLLQSNGSSSFVGTINNSEFLKISGSYIVSAASPTASTITVPSESARLALTSAFLVKQTDTYHAYMAMIGQDLSSTSSWLDLGRYVPLHVWTVLNAGGPSEDAVIVSYDGYLPISNSYVSLEYTSGGGGTESLHVLSSSVYGPALVIAVNPVRVNASTVGDIVRELP